MGIVGTDYTPIAGPLSFERGTLSYDQTRQSLVMIDPAGGAGNEGMREFSLDPPYVETSQTLTVFDRTITEFTRVGRYSGLLAAETGDDVVLIDPSTGVETGPVDGLNDNPLGSEARASDGNIYLLTRGIVAGFDVWNITSGTPILVDSVGSSVTNENGNQPVIPCRPEPATGNARWIVPTVSTGDTLRTTTWYIVTTDGSSITVSGDQSTGGFVHIDEDNDDFYLDEVRDFGQNGMPAWIDDARNQAIIMCEGDVSGLIVLAVDLDDNTQVNWRTVIGGSILGSSGTSFYDVIFSSYTMPIVSDSGSFDLEVHLLDLNDGSVIDTGTYNPSGDASGSHNAVIWDELRNTCYVQTNSDTAPVVAINFDSLAPAITPAPNANAFLSEPVGDVILRSSDVTNVVNENVTRLNVLLAEIADDNGSEYLNLNIDLNGHTFTNLPDESGNPFELLRKD